MKGIGSLTCHSGGFIGSFTSTASHTLEDRHDNLHRRLQTVSVLGDTYRPTCIKSIRITTIWNAQLSTVIRSA